MTTPEDKREPERPGLKAYMAFDREAGSSEGAALVFAHNVQEARKVAFPVLSGWGTEFLDVAARHLDDAHHLKSANPEKLAAGIPHVIESPKVCAGCEQWGEDLTESDYCEACEDERAAEAEERKA